MCHGGDEAQDLAQDTLVLAFEGLANLKNPQLLLHWMSKIAWNRYRERLRTGKFTPHSIDEYSESQHSGFMCKLDHPVDHWILRKTGETLANAVRALSPNLYQAFQLRVLDQLTTRDTALRLETTEMALRTRLRRARRLLRVSLGPTAASRV